MGDPAKCVSIVFGKILPVVPLVKEAEVLLQIWSLLDDPPSSDSPLLLVRTGSNKYYQVQ
jgi:hypothetical protein